jgi:hypothetical protein
MTQVIHIVITDLNDVTTINNWLTEHPAVSVKEAVFIGCDVYLFYE